MHPVIITASIATTVVKPGIDITKSDNPDNQQDVISWGYVMLGGAPQEKFGKLFNPLVSPVIIFD